MLSFGIYGRQLVFFLGLSALLVGAGWAIRNQVGEAAGRPVAVPTDTSSLAVDLEVLDRGRVRVDGTTVSGAVSFFKNFDELRYLLIDQSATFLDRLQVTIRFPRPVDPTAAKATAIVNHDLGAVWQAEWTDSSNLVYTVENLGPAGALTLVVVVPKDVIQPSLPQRLFGTIRSLPQTIWLALALVMPLLAAAIMVITIWPHLRRRALAVSHQMRSDPPERLPPAVAAVLADGRVSARAIAATLLDLAGRDYLAIGSHDQTYTFTKRRRLLSADAANDLVPFERTLLAKIFTQAPQASADDIGVRIGHRLFSRKVAAVYLGIYEAVTRAGYFVDNPASIAGSYRLAGLLMFFSSIIGFIFGAIFFADPPTPLLFWVGSVAASLVVIIFAPRMPAHTPLGLARRRDWLAFSNYLSASEPIDWQAQNQQKFFDYLPYAVALSVEAAWAARFVGAPFQIPAWYHSQTDIVRWEDFLGDLFPIVGYLARELAAAKEPTLS